MTTGQKVIKGVGISLGILLIVGIMFFVFLGINSFFGFIPLDDDIKESNKNLFVQDNYDIQNIEIELSYTNLLIKNGQELKVETNNDEIKILEEDHKLIIEEEKKKLLGNYKDYEVIIYMPVSKVFNEVDIDADAGRVEIASLECYDLDLNLGAGSTYISNLVVLSRGDIEGGVGSFNIKNGSLNNTKFDMGVGKSSLTAKLTGSTMLESGVGAMDITVIGNKEDYKVRARKGIASVIYDGEKLKDNEALGIGSNLIDASSGIGKININFLQSQD